jgi:uncharacterized Tic20 family protein
LRPEEERNWAILAHLSALLAALVALAFLGPLVVLLVFGNRSGYVRHHAVEALNFQVTALLLGIAAILATLLTFGFGLLIIIPAALVYGIFWLVVIIVAAVRASNGEWYRYPLSIRIVK